MLLARESEAEEDVAGFGFGFLMRSNFDFLFAR